VFLELSVGVVMIAPDRCLFECPVHPFDLTAGPGMVRLGETMFDAMLAADAIKHVEPVARGRT
jgi:hypothetical protein